jgi:predicted ester cyclase
MNSSPQTLLITRLAVPPGLPPGLAGFKQVTSVYFTAFPNIRTTTEDQVAEGEMVVTCWTARGTTTGNVFGMPATNKSATLTGITIAHIAADKIVEQWTNFDDLGLVQQLGVVPLPG